MKCYLDLGAHHGEALSHFIPALGIDDTWHVALYEPNPTAMVVLIQNCMSVTVPARLPSLAVGKQGSASLWMHRDGREDFTLDGFGSALDDVKSTEKGLGGFAVNVGVVSLATALSLIPLCDEYHVKIDIEGAEYDLDWESLPRGAHCYVEWHDWNNTTVTKLSIQQARPDIIWHDWT
jgi:FkbM family methyltransferase